MRQNRGIFRCSETRPNELRIDENRNDEVVYLAGCCFVCLTLSRNRQVPEGQHRASAHRGKGGLVGPAEYAISFAFWPKLSESATPASKACQKHYVQLAILALRIRHRADDNDRDVRGDLPARLRTPIRWRQAGQDR